MYIQKINIRFFSGL